ncbi:MAG: methyltransferase domain-containing protein [Patescibacteria group bacterium]
MAFADPASIVNYFGLKPDMTVADFGAGSGAYALAMAEQVRPNGKVYAIDVQKDLLVTLKNTAKERHLTNLEVLWGDIENLGGSKIGDQIIDFVLLSNVLFQTKASYKMAIETKRILKPSGQVAIIDWAESFGGLGPRPEDIMAAEEAKKIFGQAGFAYEKSFPVGDHHYGLIFKK